MAVDEKRFAADLERSEDARIAVANWLLLERNADVRFPPPTGHGGSDHGDLLVGGKRFEVKQRIQPKFKSFTSPDDYPYRGSILVCEAYRFDDIACRVCGVPLPRPEVIFNVNGDLTHAVAAFAASSDTWEKRYVENESRYERPGFYYYAPIRACAFFDIRVTQGGTDL